MRISTLVLITFLLLGTLVSVGVWRWPSYRRDQQRKSGFQAAELASHLAYLENKYRIAHGTFTDDFSRLRSYMEEDLPCPLSTPYICGEYEYVLDQGRWLVAISQSNPENYIAFELLQGGVDCSHAPSGLEKTPICSSLQ